LTWYLDGQPEPAQRELAVALDGFRAVGDRWGILMVLSAMTELAHSRDDHGGSVAPMDEALRLAEELTSTIDLADLLRIRGDGYVRAGDLDRADADYLRALEFARQAGAPEVTAAAYAGLGEIARLRDDLGTARRLCEAALAACPTGWFGAEATRFDILVALGRIAAAAGDAEAARTWYHEALTATGGVARLSTRAQSLADLT
jgi:tetratricopeptide (TPR) repeat protein